MPHPVCSEQVRSSREEDAVPTLELTRDEIVAEMERVAQRRRHVSALDIVRQFHAGTLDDPGELADLLMLGDLLDLDDELSTAV
jgi:hypothetical protein